MARRGSSFGGRKPQRHADRSGVMRPYSRGFVEWINAHGIQHNLPVSSKPVSDPHQSHQGKPSNHLQELRKKRGRIGNQNGSNYEKLVVGLFPDFIHTPGRKGVDLISRDGTVFIEVKGTKDMVDLGRFSKIKALNRKLMNENANMFAFVTNTHVYLCDAEKLRAFVRKHYDVLTPWKPSRGNDQRYRIRFSIRQLIDAGVLTTPVRIKDGKFAVQGWEYDPITKRLKQPLANAITPVSKRKSPQWDEKLEDAPIRGPMRHRKK